MSRTQTERQAIRDSHPDSWIAVNEGDTLYGKVLDVTEAWSEQRAGGSWYPLLTIGELQEATGYRPKHTSLKVHCFGAVLYNEVLKHRPEVGEKVRITYKGTGEAKQRGMNPPELYTLRVEGRTDQAQRAYDRIEGGTVQRPGTQAGERPADAQPEPESAEQQTLADDDIPF